MHPFRFGLLASNHSSVGEWRALARTAEHLGYSSLYVTDHFDSQFGPLVATTVAAEATEHLNVGTLVLNNDLRNPVVLAKEIATLGLLAEGRIEIGFGAGWLLSDYRQTGIGYDRPRARVERLSESLRIMKALWADGEVTFDGQHVSVAGSRCVPRPAVSPRVIVGGGSKRVLTLAAEEADIVNVNISLASGEMGRGSSNLADFDHYDGCLGWVKEGAAGRLDSLEIQIFAFACLVVGSTKMAVRSARLYGLSGDDSLELPNVLLGTIEELCERLIGRRERWGFSHIVVPAEAVETFAPVVARLAGQ
jgi:probable F420-dependent oxidoreductase